MISERCSNIQTLVEVDETYRRRSSLNCRPWIENWSFINSKAGGDADQKRLRVALQIKLALLSLVQDYHRLEEIAASIVKLAKRSPELSRSPPASLTYSPLQVAEPLCE